ncbi:acyltransferase domain-containing protein [Acidocella facilis]|uniref:acyltransferase domain-containing protein n=1 Tax=Acidocella facilis TaxID=525 RepID=UPI00047AEEA0|nr:acyltransferase domain-containing protein [Acidocella facilis]
MTIAILCSGQGAQSAGMFTLLADAPAAAPVFAAAKIALERTDPRDLVQQASSAAFHANKLGQILCCTQALAAWAVINDRLPRPLVVAGYSVGELAAWGIAGLLDMPAVLALAVERAAVMDAATLEPSGLAAVRGLSQAVLEKLCHGHSCFIAIVNAPDQMLVGGTHPALAALIANAQTAGAAHTVLLPVAVASHTPLLATASRIFGEKLAAAPIRDGLPEGIRLLSGIDGAPVFDVAAGAAKLARQIQQTVDWAACMDNIRSSTVSKVIELGPGSALAHMMRDEMPEADVHSLAEFHSLVGFMHWIGQRKS